jgi:hypothetical protein
MADSNSRSDRGRDPLAELARLIGQGDASADRSRGPARARAPAARDVDWMPENRFPLPDEDRYPAPRSSVPPPAPRPAQNRGRQDQGFEDHDDQNGGYPNGQRHHDDQGYQDSQTYQNGQSYHSNQGYPDDRRGYQDDPRGYADDSQGYQHQSHQQAQQGYEDQADQEGGYEAPAGSRFFSGQAGQFNGFRDEPDQGLPRYQDAGANLPAARGYPSTADGHGYESDQQHYAEDEAQSDEHDYHEPRRPRRRTGLVAIMAVFALMIVGTAGAFGYRAMFGGSVLPTLPPIIKASGGPNKIALDPQAGAGSNAGQGVATTGSTESLESREEQPVAIDAPRSSSRVVSTVPIAPGSQGAVAPGMSGLAAANQGDSVWPAPPPTMPAAAATPAPPVSSEPKKIHTVTIRNDQTGAVPDNTAAAAPTAAARPQSRANAAPKTTASIPAGSAGPMSIVPGQGGDAAAPAAAPRTRTAAISPAPATGGGSYVQVTSRRSEGEAQTEFRTLQAKFPSQLNGREPVIRRADLGEKGVYYRALVGPFASAEEAAQLCSGLKAAGGNCIVQK